MDLTAVKIVMQRHGNENLHWFHRLFNLYYEFKIEGPELLSLLSPTQNTFLPDCIDKIRVLLKEHYKTVANLTTAEHMPKLERFVDDTALHAFIDYDSDEGDACQFVSYKQKISNAVQQLTNHNLLLTYFAS